MLVYFGKIGERSKFLSSYFERNGVRKLGTNENPAEWMLEVIGAAPGSVSNIDWPQIWKDSPERAKTRKTLPEMKTRLSATIAPDNDPTAQDHFATGPLEQLLTVTTCVFQQY